MTGKCEGTRNGFANKISQRLKLLVASKKGSQSVQARQMKISEGSLSKYLNADATPDGITLYKLAKYYTCSADYILGLAEGKVDLSADNPIFEENKLCIQNFHKELMDLIVKYNFTQIEISSNPLKTGWRDEEKIHEDKIDFKFSGVFQK